MEAPSVLLIFPPFTSARSPYASLPVLAAWLRSRGIRVGTLDANREFYHRFLTPERLRDSQARVAERFLELNGKPELGDRSEMREYTALVHALVDAQAMQHDLDRFFDDLEPQRKAEAANTALSLVSLPFWPEYLTMDPKKIHLRYRTGFSPYSSQAVLDSVERAGLLSGFFEELLHPIIERDRPDVIGISVPFAMQFPGAMRCARAIKRRFPKLHIVMGGGFPSFCMRKLEAPRLFDFIDSYVLDDGEIPLETLAQEIASGRPDLGRVPGLVWRENGAIRRNPPAPLMALDQLPPPDFSTMELDRYILPRNQLWLPLRASRGCSWARCAFCRTEMDLIRCHQQPAADFLHEHVRRVLEATGANRVTFTDEAGSPALMETLARRWVDEKRRFSWSINVRFDRRISFDQAELFRASGCTFINGGIETLSDRLLRLVRKGTSTRGIAEILSNTACAGIESVVYMMVGFPTETVAEARRSFAAVKKMKRQGLIHTFKYNALQILQGSVMAREPEKFGITRIEIPPGHDLEGAITSFECAGMSRRQVARLSAEFNDSTKWFAPVVKLDGREVRLRHDLRKIHRALLTATGSS